MVLGLTCGTGKWRFLTTVTSQRVPSLESCISSLLGIVHHCLIPTLWSPTHATVWGPEASPSLSLCTHTASFMVTPLHPFRLNLRHFTLFPQTKTPQLFILQFKPTFFIFYFLIILTQKLLVGWNVQESVSLIGH